MPAHLINTIPKMINALSNLPQHDIVVLGIDDTLWHSAVNKYDEQPILTHPDLPALLHYLQETRHPIILLTSREEDFRQQTIEQLDKMGLVYDVLLQAPNNKDAILVDYLDRHRDHFALSQRVHIFDNEGMPISHILDAINKTIIHYDVQLTTQCLANSDFPSTLQYIEQPISLGGGTASTFKVTDSCHQQKYVLKFGSSEAQIKLELLANLLYRRLGVAVPNIQAYRAMPDKLAKHLGLPHTARMVQLSTMLQAKSEQKKELIMAQARQDFVVHALIGNIDIAKMDNFIHADDGEIYLIDAGANFLFRALGESRAELPNQVTEIDSLRTHPTSAEWFKDISEREITLQVKELIQKRHSIEETIWEVSQQLELPFSLQEQLLSGLSHRLDDLATRFGFATQAFAKRDKIAIEHQTAAGVMHLRRNHSGHLEVLLSKRARHNWCDNFGGKSDAKDQWLARTAQREVKEESNGILYYSDRELAAAPFHDIITYEADSTMRIYRMYFVESQIPLDINELSDDEHTSHHWVALAALQEAIFINTVMIEEGKKTVIVNDIYKEKLIIFPPLYDMLKQEPVKTLIHHLLNPPAQRYFQRAAHTQGIATNPDAYAEKRYRPLTSPQQVKTDISQTLLNKSKVLATIKQRPRHHFFKAPNAPTLSPSEWHLKAIMGSDFKDDAPIERNVTLFLENHQTVIFTDNEKSQFIAQAVEMINHERHHPDDVFFYHATSSNIAYAYQIYTTIYRMLAANSNVDIFRMDNLLFHSCLNIQAFISYFQSQSSNGNIDNYEPGYMECALSTNLFLFGSHNTHNSYTIDYYKKNISQGNINLKDILVANLQSMKISSDTITKLAQLIDLFPYNNQGVLHQIRMPRKDAKYYAYTAAARGRLNPFKTQDGECSDVVPLLNMLADNRLSKEYVTSVQARLMVPPSAPITTKAYYLNQSVNKLNLKHFEQQLKQLAADCVFDILRHRNQFNKLNANTALTRYLPEIYQQVGLRDAGIDDINDDILIDLLQARDFETIKMIAIALPEYRDKPLCSSKLNNQRFLLRNQNQTLLERLLAISGTGETIRAIYTDNFYEGKLDKLLFHKVIAAVLVDERWQVVNTYPQYLSNQNFVAVFKAIPEEMRLKFAINYSDKIIDSYIIYRVLIMLPEATRLNIAVQWQEKCKSGHDGIANILEALPEAARLDFVTKFSEKITHFSQMPQILANLPEAFRLKFALMQSNKFDESGDFIFLSDLLSIIKTLPQVDKLNYAMRYKDSIQTGEGLYDILTVLPEEKRLMYAIACQSTINELYLYSARNILNVLPDNERLEFALTYLNQIKTYLNKINYELKTADILEKLPETDRLQFEAMCKDNIMAIPSLGLSSN